MTSCNKKRRTRERERRIERRKVEVQKSGGALVASLLLGINAWTSVTRTIVSRQDTLSLSRKVTMTEISCEKPEEERIPWKETKS